MSISLKMSSLQQAPQVGGWGVRWVGGEVGEGSQQAWRSRCNGGVGLRMDQGFHGFTKMDSQACIAQQSGTNAVVSLLHAGWAAGQQAYSLEHHHPQEPATSSLCLPVPVTSTPTHPPTRSLTVCSRCRPRWRPRAAAS
jgi:hypothetical protein